MPEQICLYETIEVSEGTRYKCTIADYNVAFELEKFFVPETGPDIAWWDEHPRPRRIRLGRAVAGEYPRRGRGVAATPSPLIDPRRGRGRAGTPSPRTIRDAARPPRWMTPWSAVHSAPPVCDPMDMM